MFATAPLRAQRTAAELTILPEEVGTISPRIYGQFTEHIGRLIYEGIWVGADSAIPNRGGYRLDTIRALERVRPAVFRWPGGCFADAYRWEDGVGPREKRPIRRNHWWLRDESNRFGTDEFLRWCEQLNAEPYLSVNVGSATPADALNWLEYCNGSGASQYAAMRARNGHQSPYGVRFWGIGNENWGCGGLFTAAEYAQRFRQYAVYFKRMGLSSDTELVGVGNATGDWNRQFLDAVGNGLPYLDHLSVHRYFRRGHSTRFTDTDYDSLMQDLPVFEKVIRDALAAIDEVEPRRARIPVFGKLSPKPLGLIVDEWGVWHEDAAMEDGFSQHCTLRDALFAACCLNLFHRYAARIRMTNIAQVINCLQSLLLTQGQKILLTPTFHVYEMYRNHQGARSLRVEPADAGLLSASASRREGSLLLTLVNRSQTEDTDLRVNVRAGRPRDASALSLTGTSTHAENTYERPDQVSPRPAEVRIQGQVLTARVAARSVQAVRVNIS